MEMCDENYDESVINIVELDFEIFLVHYEEKFIELLKKLKYNVVV